MRGVVLAPGESVCGCCNSGELLDQKAPIVVAGFAGPVASGKTTLVKELANELENAGYSVGVVEETVRTVFERWKEKYGFESLSDLRNSDKIVDFQLEVLQERIKKEDFAVANYDIVLIDGTTYSDLLYTMLHHNHNYARLEEYIDLFRRTEFRHCSARYDVIFLCEALDGAHVDDGFRTPDLQYRKLQQFAILRLIPERIPVISIPQEPLEKRVCRCLDILNAVYGVEW